MKNRKLKNVINIENTKNYLIALTLALTSFLVMLNSPQNPWCRRDLGTDSAIFKTVAFMMNKGFLPWRDSFDHKGPLIYVINYLGYLISPDWGVFVLEIPFMFITLLSMYLIARLKCDRILSLVTTLISASLLGDFLGGGNYVEEYALPFISIALYIFLDYFINLNISRKRLALCGACFAGVLLLRPNMIAIWIVFCFAVFIKCLIDKQFKSLIGFILFFIVGITIMILPFAIWLLDKGLLSECIETYISFNRTYVDNMAKGSLWNERFIAFTFFLKHIVELIAIIACVYLTLFREHVLYLLNGLCIAVTLILVSMSGMLYDHYGLVIIPCLVFPIAAIFEECRSLFGCKINFLHDINVMVLIMGVMLMGITGGKWIKLFESSKTLTNPYGTEDYSTDVLTACEYVDKNTDVNDKISVYGNWGMIYLHSERMHATKYAYQYPIGDVSTEIYDEYYKQLGNELPVVMVIEHGHMDQRMKEFLTENNYALIWEGSSEDEENGAMVWKRYI